ncbi:MAG: chorismate mutase [Candidatus Gracilibacteria bacterium]|nr:chorismate mutase [Candidatus Gracilibacteria bacterium]
MSQLLSYRERIDEIDEALIELLGERFQFVKQVGIYKKEHNLPPLQPGRWAEVVRTRTAWAVERGLSPEFIEKLWNDLHEYALEEEAKV